MGSYFMLFMITITLLVTVMEKSTQAYVDAIAKKREISMYVAKETSKQSDKLAIAQSLYFKTYKVYPSGIDELIAKGLLRDNYKTTGYSKDINLDANNNIVATSRNDMANSYLQGNQERFKSKHQKLVSENRINQDSNIQLSDTELEKLLNNL
jgi:hypothetical protein